MCAWAAGNPYVNSLKVSLLSMLELVALKVGLGMPNRMPLDISKCDDGDPDEVFQLEIGSPRRSPELVVKTDHELNALIAGHKDLLKLPLRDGGAKVQKRLDGFLDEREYRKRKQEQKDCRESKSQATGSRLGQDDVQILNLAGEAGRRQQSSSNARVFTGEREGGIEKTKTLSDIMAGPSQRPGLRSGSKQCKNFRVGQLPSRSSPDGTGSCDPYRKQTKDTSFWSSLEVQSTNSPRGGAAGKRLGKRSRQGLGDGDSPEKVVELFSSDDEAETRTTVADYKAPNQRRSFGNRSNYVSSMEGLRIAYPSREDPEAVEVVYEDLRRLDPMEFLNDTVIDFYIKYLQRPEGFTEERKVKFYFFNTFFYKKLCEVPNIQNKKHEPDLSKLRKWTKGTNIFEKEYLIIPIHDKWHWSLAIVCPAGPTNEDSGLQRYILHLDSMNPGHKSHIVFRLLKTYLLAEWRHQATEDGNESRKHLNSEDFIGKKIPVPQQENESDCGLFLLHYIEKFIEKPPSAFDMSDVDQGKLFGREWFHPSRASGLRKRMQELLQRFFDEEASRASAVRAANKIMTNQPHEVENLVKDVVEDGNTVTRTVSDSKDASLMGPTESTLSPGQDSAAGHLQHACPSSSTANESLSLENLAVASGRTVPSSKHAQTVDGSEERPRTSTDGDRGKSASSPIPQALVETRSAVEVGADGRPDGIRESRESQATNVLQLSERSKRDSGDGSQTDCRIVVDLSMGEDKRTNEKLQKADSGNDLSSSPMQTS